MCNFSGCNCKLACIKINIRKKNVQAIKDARTLIIASCCAKNKRT